MTRFRLLPEDGFQQRFEQLCEKANELGISITWSYSNVVPTIVTDTRTNKEYQLRDQDSSEHGYEFPPTLEYKLTFEK